MTHSTVPGKKIDFRGEPAKNHSSHRPSRGQGGEKGDAARLPQDQLLGGGYEAAQADSTYEQKTPDTEVNIMHIIGRYNHVENQASSRMGTILYNYKMFQHGAIVRDNI